MTVEPGWYPDPTNPHITRLWTGTGWGDERVWNGTAWVSRPVGQPAGAPFAAPPPPVQSQVPPPPPGPLGAAIAAAGFATPAAQLSPARKIVLVGAIVGAVGAFMPFEEATTFGVKITSSPRSPILLLAVLGAAAWAGWTIRHRILLTVFAAIAALFVAGGFSSVADDHKLEPSAKAAGGLILYSIGVGIVVLGVIRAWMAGRKPAVSTVVSPT